MSAAISKTDCIWKKGSLLCIFALFGLALISGCKGGPEDSATSPAAERQGLVARLKVIDADLAAVKSNTAMDATQKAAAVAELEAQRTTAQGALAKLPAAPVK